MKRIFTERLMLRLLRVDDVTPAYIKALNNPKVVGLTEARHRRWTKNNVIDYIIQARGGKAYLLIGIFLKDEGRHIGNIRIFNIHPVHQRAELGIMIFDPHVWGQGLATEALMAIEPLAFDQLGLHRLHADYYEVNQASAKMFKRAGYHREGLYQEHFQLNGRFINSIRVAKLNKRRV